MRQYFSDLSVGDSTAISVLITSASPRKTKAMKPYLVLELFDGRDKLVGNYWDWAGKATPSVGDAVYNITGQVTEYLGKKQITVSGITSNVTTPVTDFMPSSGLDLDKVFKDTYAFITTVVNDDLLRDLCLAALDTYKEYWLTTPAATGVHHAFVGGTLIHSFSVAKIAYSIASTIDEVHTDLCVVGALLHDIGKLEAYSIDGVTMCMTDTGKLFEHAHIGANMLMTVAYENITPKNKNDALKLDILQHIVLSHHGTLEFGAIVEPQCIEAHIVHTADKIDATVEMIKEASNKTEEFWTDKVWALNNRQMINYKHIKNLHSYEFNDDELEIIGAEDVSNPPVE